MLRVDPQRCVNGGVEVRNAHGILDRLFALIIRDTVGTAVIQTTAGENQ